MLKKRPEIVTTSRRIKFDPWLLTILLAAIGVYGWRVWQTTSLNNVYTATVISMTKSLHNFWFASFEPTGLILLGKPPVALWGMVLTTKLFGVHAWSLKLPALLFSLGAVWLLYRLVKPHFGVLAARITALLLMLTPVFVVNARTNNVGATLIFWLLLTVMCLRYAARKQQLRWLWLSFTLVGISFNVAMLPTLVILPILYGYYWLISGQRWTSKLRQLGLLTVYLVFLLAIWPVSVVMNQSNQTQYRSALSLVLTQNKVQTTARRNLTKRQTNKVVMGTTTQRAKGSQAGLQKSAPTPTATLFKGDNRLLIGWFVPLALVGLLSSWWFYRRQHKQTRLTPQQRELILWGAWLLLSTGYLGLSSAIQTADLTVLAPALAALAGIGCTTLFKQWCQQISWQKYLLPVATLATVALQAILLAQRYPIAPWVLLLIGVIVTGSLMGIQPRRQRGRLLISLSLFVMLLAPSWCVLAVVSTNSALQLTDSQGNQSVNPALLKQVQDTRGHAKYLFATQSMADAAPYVVKTQQPVLAVTNISGQTTGVNLARFKKLVKTGQVKTFYLTQHSTANAISRWVQANGRKLTFQKALKTTAVTLPNPQLPMSKKTPTGPINKQQLTPGISNPAVKSAQTPVSLGTLYDLTKVND